MSVIHGMNSSALSLISHPEENSRLTQPVVLAYVKATVVSDFFSLS